MTSTSRHLLVALDFLVSLCILGRALRCHWHGLSRVVAVQIIIVAHRVRRRVVSLAQEGTGVTTRWVVIVLVMIHRILRHLLVKHLLPNWKSHLLSLARAIDCLATALEHLGLRLWRALSERVLALAAVVGVAEPVPIVVGVGFAIGD